MEEVVWGDEIAITERPDWVKDDTICTVCNDGEWFGLYVQIEAKEWCAWENPCSYTAIRLPADHSYYLATSKGFTYWPGGDKAPAEGPLEILWERDGTATIFDDPTQYYWAKDGGLTDIAGWRKLRHAAAHYAQALAEHALEAQYKGEPLPLAVPTVTLPMMTREECLAKADEKEWASPNTSRMAYLHAYEDLGLIREVVPPTDLERYKAETGAAIGGIEDAIEAAIKWARGNS